MKIAPDLATRPFEEHLHRLETIAASPTCKEQIEGLIVSCCLHIQTICAGYEHPDAQRVYHAARAAWQHLLTVGNEHEKKYSTFVLGEYKKMGVGFEREAKKPASEPVTPALSRVLSA